jgi:hypothetical protein
VAAEKLTTSHSEGLGLPEESAFPGFGEEKQIPRFARDDKKHFSRSLFSLGVSICDPAHTPACKLKPVLLLRSKILCAKPAPMLYIIKLP